MNFVEASAVSPQGEGKYAAELQPGWDVMGVTNGGYLMAIASRAVCHATDRPDPLTITAHFMAPARPGPAAIETTVLKQGRQTSTATFSFTNDGRNTMAGIATCTDITQLQGEELMRTAPPEMPEPPACIRIQPTDAFPPPLMGKVEIWMHPDDAATLMGAPTGVPLLRGWVRLPDNEPLDIPAAIMMNDVFPPTVFASGMPFAWTPTVELTVQLRHRPTSQWLACVFESRALTGGAIEVDGQVWDEAGTLITQSRQLQLVRAAS